MKPFKKRFEKKNRRCLCRIIFFIFVWAIMAGSFVQHLGAASVTDGCRRLKLDNGFTLLLKEDHSSAVAAIQVWVKTGSANETAQEAGITHLIEHMIFKGTPFRKTGEIARTIETSGGQINAYTSYDRTVYHVQIPSSSFDTALDVLLDAVQHSLFDPVELEREKEVVMEEYRRSLDSPRTRLSWSMMSLCYEKHPYGRPIIGYESTILSFDREDILKYMDKWYTPENMALVAVGDFDAEQASKTIQTLIKDFPTKTGQKPSRAVEPVQTSLRNIVLKDEVQQIYLDMSWHIPSMTHEDMPAIDVLEMILGHGKTSRLYGRLKMDANLVHGISAGAYAMADPGLFSIDATLSPDKLNSALDAVFEEIGRITLEPVTETELSRARATAEADFVFAMESMAGQARTLAFFETMEGDMRKADEYVERLKGVTSDDITRVVRSYLRPENLSMGILAPKGADITLSGRELSDLFERASSVLSQEAEEAQDEDGEATKEVLPNGMTLIIKENHRLPVVSLTGAYLGGIRLEYPEKWGSSAFAARMLTRGTRKRNASQIASTVDSWAGSLEGFSGKNSFGVSGRFLSKDLYGGLDLLADVAFDPTFPESEMEKVREDILANIKAKKDRPMPQLFDLFYKTLFRHHPYGHPQTGTEESIKSITQSGLKAWHAAFAIPQNFVLTVVGDVNRDQIIPYIKTLFGDFKISSKDLPEIPPEPPLTGSGQAHLERPGAQTHIIIGYLGADLKSKDNAPMALIETALSGQGGRLFSRLRDKSSLAYAVTAFRRPGLETGVFGVYLACDPSKLPVAKDALFHELDKIRENGLTEKELEEAKRYLLGNLKIELQTNGSQAMHMALDELYGLGYDHTRQFIRDIEAVNLKDIKRAAQKIIVPERFAFVTVGPAQEGP